MKLRISIGSAIALGLQKGGLDVPPTTCYLMLGDKCYGACGFCAQSRDAKGGDRLSRVLWPPVELKDVSNALRERIIPRICIQTLDYPGMVEELIEVASTLHRLASISVAINPLPAEQLRLLKEVGVERVGIGLDAATSELFGLFKGQEAGGLHNWEETLDSLKNASEVFGRGRATTHIIVGLGETDHDLATMVAELWKMGISTSLFAATPLRGTRMRFEPPPLNRYRALQATRELVIIHDCSTEEFGFDENGKMAAMPDGWENVSPAAFMTRGCPDCNRPYYNEKPGGTMYNYPRPISAEEHRSALEQIREYLR
ncbi:MAG: radical SAM protein [Candidatus Thermoplasmatota archaeon]|nr:radical SAM protein [Candidatus Thermoplasmatota archaeon]